MIAVDANVLLRLVVVDNERQNAAASRFFKARSKTDPAYVSEVVLAEFVWVLGSRYRYPQDAIIEIVARMLDTQDLLFAQADAVRRVVTKPDKAAMVDQLIAGLSVAAGCEKTVTFDRNAARAIDTMELLK